jgi:hypothetical protein
MIGHLPGFGPVRRKGLLVMAVALATLASACASPSPGSATVADQSKRVRYLFISPHGEPFRAAANEPPALDKWFAQADADKDGRISHAEFVSDAQGFFKKLDADSDGAIVSPEVTALQQKSAPEVLRIYGPMEDFVGPREAELREALAQNPRATKRERERYLDRPHGAQAYGLLNEVEPAMSADADLNRRVTPAEFEAAANRRFGKLDLNADGYFVMAEAPGPVWPSVRKTGQ